LLKRIVPYALLLPAFILICIFKIYPIVLTLVQGFVVDGNITLKTYITLFNDPSFWNSLRVTLKLNVVMIPLQIFISFWLAMLVNQTLKGITVFRTIFYLPFTLSLTVATLIWNLMFNYNSGIINSILSIFGIAPQGFFIDKNQALWCIVIIATWKGCGYWMMFILAGLKNIDTSIYESAKIDGSGFLTTVVKITLPLLKKVLLFVLVANTTANLLLFAPMQLVTQGGPQGSTNVLMFEAYKSAFKYANQPRASALITVLLVLIVTICIVQFKFLNEKEERVA
jgi:multiple sugar transport system permease protein